MCPHCKKIIRIMTPPRVKIAGLPGLTEVCSELCRKCEAGEITHEEWERMQNAAVQKSPTQN